MKKLALYALPGLAVVATLAVSPAARADEDELDAGRVIAVEARPYRMVHEFSAFAGILPIDALYTGYSLGAAYTLHLSDLWAWEVVNFQYSANVDSDLKNVLAERWSVAATKDPRINYMATSHLVFSPLFGKFALFNDTILYAETYLSVGGGIARFDDGFRPALSVGPGARLYFGQRVSARLDVHSVISPDIPAGVDHILVITLGVSFNFGNVRATETGFAEEREVTDPFQTLDELYPESKPRGKERAAK
jgi:outer membrane beta-barrel protein